mgnify:CR=1 FL=1
MKMKLEPILNDLPPKERASLPIFSSYKHLPVVTDHVHLTKMGHFEVKTHFCLFVEFLAVVLDNN